MSFTTTTRIADGRNGTTLSSPTNTYPPARSSGTRRVTLMSHGNTGSGQTIASQPSLQVFMSPITDHGEDRVNGSSGHGHYLNIGCRRHLYSIQLDGNEHVQSILVLFIHFQLWQSLARQRFICSAPKLLGPQVPCLSRSLSVSPGVDLENLSRRDYGRKGFCYIRAVRFVVVVCVVVE
jgi:hypothetical protein